MDGDAGGAEVVVPPLVRRHCREPIRVAPFLEFCRKREEQIRRELNEYPAIGLHGGASYGTDARTRLVLSFGWDVEAGLRKLHRWSHPEGGEHHSGWVDRAEIEDALAHAGARFGEVYDIEDEPLRTPVRLGQHRRMTDAQVIAAHTVYVKARMTMYTMAELLWQRYGYVNADGCRKALAVAFRGLGLSTRRCAATTRHARPCRNHPLRGCDFCAEHDDSAVHPSQLAVAARQRNRMAGIA